jgi:hypothetical protein
VTSHAKKKGVWIAPDVCLSKIKSGHIGGAASREWGDKDLPGPFDGTRDRRILLQG